LTRTKCCQNARSRVNVAESIQFNSNQVGSGAWKVGELRAKKIKKI